MLCSPPACSDGCGRDSVRSVTEFSFIEGVPLGYRNVRVLLGDSHIAFQKRSREHVSRNKEKGVIMKTGITIALIVAAVALSIAQDSQSKDSPVAKKPDPAKERAKLSFVVGKFNTATRVMPSRMSPKEVLGKGTSVARWGLDSMFILIDEQSINPLLGNYKGHGILGYDANEQQYVLSMFNNFGDRPQYKGTFSGDTLSLVTKVQFPRGAFDQKVLWFAEGNNVRMTVLNDMGKGFQPVLEQTNTPAE